MASYSSHVFEKMPFSMIMLSSSVVSCFLLKFIGILTKLHNMLVTSSVEPKKFFLGA